MARFRSSSQLVVGSQVFPIHDWKWSSRPTGRQAYSHGYKFIVANSLRQRKSSPRGNSITNSRDKNILRKLLKYAQFQPVRNYPNSAALHRHSTKHFGSSHGCESDSTRTVSPESNASDSQNNNLPDFNGKRTYSAPHLLNDPAVAILAREKLKAIVEKEINIPRVQNKRKRVKEQRVTNQTAKKIKLEPDPDSTGSISRNVSTATAATVKKAVSSPATRLAPAFLSIASSASQAAAQYARKRTMRSNFINKNNNCYANAAMQLLSVNQPFVNVVMNHKCVDKNDCWRCHLQHKFIELFKPGSKRCHNIDWATINKILKKGKIFRKNEEADSVDFIDFSLEKVYTEFCYENLNTTADSSEWYHCIRKSEYDECQRADCGYRTAKKTTNCVALTYSALTGQKNLQQKVSVERKGAIDNEPRRTCRGCAHKRCVHRITTIESAAKFVLVALDRNADPYKCKDKIPVSHKMSFLASDPTLHELKGGIIHVGGAKSGHYTALLKLDGEWYHFDCTQNNTKKMSEEAAFNNFNMNGSYFLYERVENAHATVSRS